MAKDIKRFRDLTVYEPVFDNNNVIMSKKATEMTERQQKRDQKFLKIAVEIIKGTLTQS